MFSCENALFTKEEKSRKGRRKIQETVASKQNVSLQHVLVFHEVLGVFFL